MKSRLLFIAVAIASPMGKTDFASAGSFTAHEFGHYAAKNHTFVGTGTSQEEASETAKSLADEAGGGKHKNVSPAFR